MGSRNDEKKSQYLPQKGGKQLPPQLADDFNSKVEKDQDEEAED